MLDYIVISAEITPIEANYITANSQFKEFVATPTGKKTTELSKMGIRDINVWFNMNSIINSPLTEKTCLLNITLDATIFRKTSWYNIQKVITNKIPDSSFEFYNFNRKYDLDWKVKSATFIYNFIGEQAETYYKLLRGGRDLTKSKLKKSVTETLSEESDNIISATEYTGITQANSDRYYESVRLRIEYNKKKPTDTKSNKNEDNAPEEENTQKDTHIQEEKKYPIPDTLGYLPYRIRKDRLQIKISTRRSKISTLCRKYGIDRDFIKFWEKEEIIDADLFEHYITHITGSGDFYKYKDAEKIIMKSDYSKKEKDKMCDVLKAVASYKGISNYLNHVEDEEVIYDCMLSVRKKVYAQKVLNNLQKCGINPLTISVRTKIPCDKLDNLVTVYKNMVISKKKSQLSKRKFPKTMFRKKK